MKFMELCEIIENKEIVNGIYKMEFSTDKIAKESKAGQFLQIKVNGLIDPLLRRPISINEIKENNLIIYYKVVGKGTDLLTQIKKGGHLDVIGPLGNGFDTSYKDLKIAIVGGGIGIAPLLETAKVLSTKNNIDTYLGFNDDVYLCEEFKCVSGEVKLSTVTGKVGHKGYITEVLLKDMKKYDMIIACGPALMLKEIKRISEEFNVPCQLSLEERMGCGFGACVGCSIETTDNQMKKVCVDGPVFLASEVNL